VTQSIVIRGIIGFAKEVDSSRLSIYESKQATTVVFPSNALRLNGTWDVIVALNPISLNTSLVTLEYP
jgi:hypothetical protein